MLRLKKITCKDKKWTVIAEQSNGQDWDEVQFTSADEPQPSLIAALAALRGPVLDILEMDDSAREVEKLTATGVGVGEGDAGIMGATLVARRTLLGRNCPMNLITPHLFEEYTSGSDDGDPKQLLPHECRHLLYDLQEEALAYLAGKRSQLSLFTAEELPTSADEGLTLDFAEGAVTMSPEQWVQSLKLVEQVQQMSDVHLVACMAAAQRTQNLTLAGILASEFARRGLAVPVAS